MLASPSVTVFHGIDPVELMTDCVDKLPEKLQTERWLDNMVTEQRSVERLNLERLFFVCKLIEFVRHDNFDL